MAESQDDTGSMGEVSDDGRTTINANNSPATADSAWTSRRGKARCDSCRLRNLKCDRILPTCNQCRWTPVTDCTYTPLPTPAHRGVPRCDRCRESNLKCDRAAPVCQYCREGNITDCRYTPKKRARPPLDSGGSAQPTSRVPYSTQAHTASFMFTNISGPVETHPTYNRPFVNESAPSSSRSESASSHHRTIELDRSAPSYPRKASFSEGPPLALLPAPAPPAPYPAHQPFISHSFPEPIRNLQLKPWSHPSFIPLPDPIPRRLGNLLSAEMPSRESFDKALEDFLANLMPDLRETACLPPEAYATLANCLSKGNITRLSTRIRSWATCHRLCSGSDKLNLILAPRDSVFQITQDEEQRMIREYRGSLDGPSRSAPSPSQKSDKDSAATSEAPVFERLPVQPQIYDCLAYAHRGHASSVAVLMEIRRLGIASITWPMAEIFIKLCPLCIKAGSGVATKNSAAGMGVVSR
ncbi:hypothetical protein B0H17DRAFT_1049427 [Mycena rosella]|uniref:Zn(2)-C6 fungal-type domain-containing protein n=1 Tax=Mycena rosella TaxID=1033263 RepID=A0AAD7GPK6_MYCRO|nr:hypothetical protein B0H17DRAFT_1049427 [Mycena rosella]